MSKVRFRLCAAALALASLSAGTQAAVVYTYAGTNFTVFQTFTDRQYTTSDSITGSFSLASGLAANLNAATVAVASFDFFDGHKHLDQTNTNNGAVFAFSTDASGAITEWNITLGRSISAAVSEEILTRFQYGSYYDEAERINFDYCNGACVSRGFAYGAGTWSVAGLPAVTPGTVPEPASLALVGLALAGLAGSRRSVRGSADR